jgi:hypothetical protein
MKMFQNMSFHSLIEEILMKKRRPLSYSENTVSNTTFIFSADISPRRLGKVRFFI